MTQDRNAASARGVPHVGPLASWMYDHPRSYVVVLAVMLAALLGVVGLFWWAVLADA